MQDILVILVLLVVCVLEQVLLQSLRGVLLGVFVALVVLASFSKDLFFNEVVLIQHFFGILQP